MPDKIKSAVRVPKWLLDTIRNDAATLPIDSELSGALIHINYAFEKFQDCFVALPEVKDFFLVDGDALNKHSKFDLVEYWVDQLAVIELFVGLTLIRGMHLLKSFVRDARTEDLFAMAMSGRALLELGICSADALRYPAELIRHFTDKDEVPFGEGLADHLEQPLLQAIWGSRIGTGTLKKSKPLSEEGLPEGFLLARNMMTAIQGRANRMDDVGIAEYRVYEILCDVVHPSALGYQMILAGREAPDGFRGYRLLKHKTRPEVSVQVAVAAALGAYQGCSLLTNLSEFVAKHVPRCRDILSKSRQETTGPQLFSH